MCRLIIRKDIYVLWTESTSAGVIWVGQGQGRTRLACWLLLLMKSADLRTAKLQNIFLNPPLSNKKSKEISTGPTKPGQIRTTRSSKLITRSEADMASVEGNWVILYRWVIAGELWQCWFWTTHTSAIPNTSATAATITIGQLSVDRVITGEQEARSGNG